MWRSRQACLGFWEGERFFVPLWRKDREAVLAALPCPAGQGALCGCGATLLAPLGQGRFGRARARFWGFGRVAAGGIFSRAGFPVLGARGWRRRAAFLSLRAAFPSGGATAGAARTRSRDLSLENPIGCRAPSPCCNASWAAPAREPPGVLFVFPFQSKTRQSPPAPCSWGGRASLIRGSSGRAHCAQGAELMVSEMRFSMASMP